MSTHSLLRLMDTFVTTFLGRSQASRGKRQIITRLYSVWAVAFLTFHKGCFFFFEDTWKCKQESPLLTPPHPTPRARPCSPLQLPKCLEGHTASSVYDKGPDSGVTSICPFQRTSEKETGGSGDGDGVSLWLASFIRRAHGCLLINTPGTGASDPETSRVSVGLPPRSVCGTKHPLRQPTATTGSHQLQYV